MSNKPGTFPSTPTGLPSAGLPAGLIAGIGVDITRIDRIQGVYQRFDDKFVRRILGVDEQAVFHRRLQRDTQRGLRYLATRFAAKEAFSKAIGLGMRMPMAWSRMQTLNQPGGKPAVVLAESLAQWYEQRFGPAHVSLTDESDTVMAFVIIEQLNQDPT
ncbi:MAG TPA: holo-ACP synthase [Burkholderiaceae bacterium]|nr:holo-ACP synthase [Burkholderiaceae bacterium]